MDGWMVGSKAKNAMCVASASASESDRGKVFSGSKRSVGPGHCHTDECVHVTVDDAHFCIIKYTLRNKYTQMTLIEQGAAQPVVDDDKIHTPPHMNMIFTEARQESARKPETGPLLLFPLAAYIIKYLCLV